MISIIIASINDYRLNKISENINQTIGVEYELITYDNSIDGIGICEIYNKCAADSKFDHLVFCHDDILFRSNNWGKLLVELLNFDQVGLIGAAGAIYKSRYPAPWVSIPKQYYRSSLTTSNVKKSDYTKEINETVVLDGCFLAMRKNIWKEFNFNESELKGFHLYDIDISLRLSKEYKLLINNEIVIKHLSEGTFDQKWYIESKKFHKNNQHLFPATSDKNNNQRYLDSYAIRSLLGRSQSIHMSFSEKIKYLTLLFLKSPFNLFSIRLLSILKQRY